MDRGGLLFFLQRQARKYRPLNRSQHFHRGVFGEFLDLRCFGLWVNPGKSNMTLLKENWSIMSSTSSPMKRTEADASSLLIDCSTCEPAIGQEAFAGTKTINFLDVGRHEVCQKVVNFCMMLCGGMRFEDFYHVIEKMETL